VSNIPSAPIPQDIIENIILELYAVFIGFLVKSIFLSQLAVHIVSTSSPKCCRLLHEFFTTNPEHLLRLETLEDCMSTPIPAPGATRDDLYQGYSLLTLPSVPWVLSTSALYLTILYGRLQPASKYCGILNLFWISVLQGLLSEILHDDTESIRIISPVVLGVA
jgi:hypothetical protein